MMAESPESIKQKIEETKAKLALKFETLRQQATIDTIDEIVSVVQRSFQESTARPNIQRQLFRHPWWVVGGSLAVTYLLLGRRISPVKPHRTSDASSVVSEIEPTPSYGERSAAQSTTNSTHEKTMEFLSVEQELRTPVINLLSNALPEITSRVVLTALEVFLNRWAKTKKDTECADKHHCSSIEPREPKVSQSREQLSC